MTSFDGRIGKLRLAAKVVETLGWRWAVTRAYLEAEHRSGVLVRRSPQARWDGYELDGTPIMRPVNVDLDAGGEFLFGLPPEVETGLRDHLERLKAREFDVFGTTCRLTSWHEEPITPASYPTGRHWTKTPELPEADLKLIWEPSRFAWVYDLVRLHGLDRSTSAPDVFWRLFEDWCEANQPNTGVNWKCGQEAAIRLMAVVFGANAFSDTYVDGEREALLAKFADATAQRIESHWRYAKSQDNNHIVSEAVGLITVGLLFPGLERSTRSLKLGERLLRDACERLVFVDGGTSQYSLNYHRVFMDNFIWAMWLHQSLGVSPPAELVSALRRTHDFLLAITQKSDGAAGNWGNNDGALLLPLSSTRFLDVRPTLLMAAQALDGATHEWGGPAEEAVHWLFGRPERYRPTDLEPKNVEIRTFPYAGISIIVNGRNRALIRGGEHRLFRPPQCDFGHVEFWVEGEQTVFDPGTWSYKPRTGEPDFSETEWHNGPQVKGKEQMTRLSRFLWGDWPVTSVTSTGSGHLSLRIAMSGVPTVLRTITPHDLGWRLRDHAYTASGVVPVPTALDETSHRRERYSYNYRRMS